jgi:glyoxylase-like metal-dependent hydrolase (beta-lactamase superfamily II)
LQVIHEVDCPPQGTKADAELILPSLYSWEALTESLEKLKSWRFNWVLPGHGMRRQLAALVQRMKR